MVKRKIDELGRVVIPRDYREALGLTPQTPLVMELSEGKIVIERAGAACALCKAPIDKDASPPLCKKCIAAIKKL